MHQFVSFDLGKVGKQKKQETFCIFCSVDFLGNIKTFQCNLVK